MTPDAPWDAADLFPLKPEGPEYGYIWQGRAFACSRDELVRQCALPSRSVTLVWIPEPPRLVTAWEVPFLHEELRRRGLAWQGQRIQLSGFITILLGGLAGVNWSSRAFPLFAATAVFMGLLPLLRAFRVRAQFRKGLVDWAAMARVSRFMLWMTGRPKRSAWVLAGILAVAGTWQVIVGLHRSLEFAGHLKAFVTRGEPWRLLTGGLIHVGFLHFALNVVALVTLGKVVEALTSRWHVFLVFLASMLAGSAASQWLNPASNSVGASGGILGLLGFLAAFAMRRPGALPSTIRNWIVLMTAGVVMLGLAAPGLIDNAGHGGGFVGGAVLGWILIARGHPAIPIRAGGAIRSLGLASVAIVAAATLALPVTTTGTRLYDNLALIATLSAEEDPENAERIANRAIRLRPGDARGYLARGLSRNYLGEYSGAIEDFSKSLSVDPSLTSAYVYRSYARRMTGKAQEALADSDEALRREPGNWTALEGRIAALESLGRIEDALRESDRAIETRPQDADMRVGRAWYLVLLNRLDEAIQECETALRLKPDDAYALNTRGLAKAGKGDLDGALLDYSEAIKRDPEHRFAFSNRGEAKFLKGDLDGALEDFAAALELYEEDSGALYGRGRVRLRKGDASGARADFAEAIRHAHQGWHRREDAEAALLEVQGQ